jgi:hypothetical protein
MTRILRDILKFLSQRHEKSISLFFFFARMVWTKIGSAGKKFVKLAIIKRIGRWAGFPRMLLKKYITAM